KDYEVFDLTAQTPLLTEKAEDESGKKWDAEDETGLRYDRGVKDVEIYRDVKPILDRSCVRCHTSKWKQPAGNLVLDDDELRGAPAVRGPPHTTAWPWTTRRSTATSRSSPRGAASRRGICGRSSRGGAC